MVKFNNLNACEQNVVALSKADWNWKSLSMQGKVVSRPIFGFAGLAVRLLSCGTFNYSIHNSRNVMVGLALAVHQLFDAYIQPSDHFRPIRDKVIEAAAGNLTKLAQKLHLPVLGVTLQTIRDTVDAANKVASEPVLTPAPAPAPASVGSQESTVSVVRRKRASEVDKLLANAQSMGKSRRTSRTGA
jgi:hypothetical protein